MNNDYISRLEMFRLGALDAEDWRPFLKLDEDAYREGYEYVSQGICRYCNELLEHCDC